MGAFLIIRKNQSVQSVKELFGSQFLSSLQPFRDAGVGPDDFPLTVIDCWKGLERAIQLNWYSYARFDSCEFEQMLKHGDLSWVVPNQIIAFSSPTGGGGYGRAFYSGALGFSPDELIDSFHDLGVKGVIRLNDRLYDAGMFEKNGVRVHEMEFPDGSCPKDHIIADFINLTEEYTRKNQAVAVHCRAGLGRTGTLIGLYIMHKFGFDPKPLIAWMRLCRVGMVVGE